RPATPSRPVPAYLQRIRGGRVAHRTGKDLGARPATHRGRLEHVQTITFYAYKGGTGRTLALANAAIYLARLKQRVFAIDLDLEAPGLHHKLALSPCGPLPPIERGMVDCIHTFVAEHRVPETLSPYTISIPREEERD